METLPILSAEERQANIDALIEKFKASKKQSKQETLEDANRLEFQEALRKLKQRNARRGTAIVGV